MHFTFGIGGGKERREMLITVIVTLFQIDNYGLYHKNKMIMMKIK
jgi:hypothetical protein